MHRIIIHIISIILLLSCKGGNKHVEISCVDKSVIFQKSNLIPSYKMDSITYSNNKLVIKFNLLEFDFFEFQAEREFMFYILSDLKSCKSEQLDSIKVLFVITSNPSKKQQFSYDYKELVRNLNLRDSLMVPYYNDALSYFISKKNHYRALTTIFSDILGAVINNNDNGMYNVDFFEFLLSYTNDVYQEKNKSTAFQQLDQIEMKVMDSGLLPEYKSEALDFIKYLKDMKTKSKLKTV